MEAGLKRDQERKRTIDIIDLTRRLEDSMAVFSGHPPVSITRHLTAGKDGRNVEKISMGGHTGTHVDVPYHFIDKGFSSENISLPSICGAVVLVNIAFKDGKPITVKDIQGKKEKIKTLKKLVVHAHWQQTGQSYYKDYPTLSADACEWLCDLNIEMLGMDTPSPGPFGQKGDEIHKRLLRENIYIIEGLTNLDRIKEDTFLLVCLPLSIKAMGGVPCRAIAITSI